MSEPLVVGAALSSRPWRGALQRHCRDHASDIAVQLLRDGFDVAAGQAVVVIVDDDTSWLSPPIVARLREQGAALIGVFDADEAEGHGEHHLRRLGVDVCVASTIEPTELAEAVRELAPDVETRQRFKALVGDHDDRVDDRHRRLVVVGGPAGAGSTEVALAVAGLWGGLRPAVVDVDEVHPTIARRLGLALHPHIITAIEAMRAERVTIDGDTELTLDDCLTSPSVGSEGAFDVIVGLAARHDWSLLRADDVRSLIDELMARRPVVVARVGSHLEDLSQQTVRFDVSRAVVSQASRIVGVADATPVGLLRFVDWMVDATQIAPEVPIDVVVNKAAVSVSQRSQLVEHLRAIVGERVGSIVVAPRDRHVERAAWDGGLVRRGGFRRAVAQLPLEQLLVGSDGPNGVGEAGEAEVAA